MITVSHLCVQAAHRSILRDISFSIPEGAFLAIIGPNGGGKSTLVRAMLGLQPYTGMITYASTGTTEVTESRGALGATGTVGTSGPADLEGPISSQNTSPAVAPTNTKNTARTEGPTGASTGYVPQIKTLDRTFPALTEELVATALKRRWPWRIDNTCRSIVAEALSQVGADHLMGQAIRNLSGGELQRVYLARALISKPAYLFLDEPAAGVDVAGAADMLECVERFRHALDATVIMVTHDWDVALHHASHALVLNQEIISYGLTKDAMNEAAIRTAFGHEGHAHGVFGGGHDHA
jgi:zinc transport system ATP-binding protein